MPLSRESDRCPAYTHLGCMVYIYFKFMDGASSEVENEALQSLMEVS